MAGNINLVNVRAVTNLVIAAELSGQRLVPLTAQQLTHAVNLIAVILAQAVILKQTPEVVMIQAARNAEQHVINQSLVVIQALRTGVRYIVLVMVIAVKTERSNLVIQNAAARDVLLQEEVLQVVALLEEVLQVAALLEAVSLRLPEVQPVMYLIQLALQETAATLIKLHVLPHVLVQMVAIVGMNLTQQHHAAITSPAQINYRAIQVELKPYQQDAAACIVLRQEKHSKSFSSRLKFF